MLQEDFYTNFKNTLVERRKCLKKEVGLLRKQITASIIVSSVCDRLVFLSVGALRKDTLRSQFEVFKKYPN